MKLRAFRFTILALVHLAAVAQARSSSSAKCGYSTWSLKLVDILSDHELGDDSSPMAGEGGTSRWKEAGTFDQYEPESATLGVLYDANMGLVRVEP